MTEISNHTMQIKNKLTPEEFQRLRVLVTKAVEGTSFTRFSTEHSGAEYEAFLERDRCLSLAESNLIGSGLVKTTIGPDPEHCGGLKPITAMARSTVIFMETETLHEIQKLLGLRI